GAGITPRGRALSRSATAARRAGSLPVTPSDARTEAKRVERAEVMLRSLLRHARPCAGHPRLHRAAARETWMAGTSPAMTECVARAPSSHPHPSLPLRL